MHLCHFESEWKENMETIRGDVSLFDNNIQLTNVKLNRKLYYNYYRFIENVCCLLFFFSTHSLIYA